MGHFVSVLFKHYKCSYSNEWKHIMKTDYMFSGWLLIGSNYTSVKVWYTSPQQFWPTLIDWSIYTMGQDDHNYPLKKYSFENTLWIHLLTIYTQAFENMCLTFITPLQLLSVPGDIDRWQECPVTFSKMQMVLYRQKCEQFMDSKLI